MRIFIILAERGKITLNKLYQIYYIGITNFLDRIRDKSVILITLFMMYVSYLFFPENNTSIYYTLNIEKNGLMYRGIYNSTWLGWVSTVAFISIISFIGFYFVNNSIKRERNLLVGEITASMPIKSAAFIFGKTFGNFLFLFMQMLIVILVTIVMQFVRGESQSIEIIKLITPFLIFAVPVCLIVSVISITFEVIPFLSGTFGNILYFFVWTGLIAAALNKTKSFLTDIFGMNAAISLIIERVKLNFKELQNVDSFNLGASGRIHNNVKTFIMNNVNVKPSIFTDRVLAVAVSLFLLLLVSFMFRRNLLLEKKGYKRNTKVINEIYDKPGLREKIVTLTPLNENRVYSNNLSMISEEINIIFKSLSLWWYVLIIIFSVCVIFTSGEVESKIFIPLIWILPITVWSKLGIADRKFNMEAYLFTCSNYRNSQLINSFIASFLFTALINIGILIKFIITGNFTGILCILIGTFFVISLGMFIGTAMGNSTAFEIIYLMLWYTGILNGFKKLDFLQVSQSTLNFNTSLLFFIIGSVLLIASIIVKNQRMKNLYN